MNYSAEEVDVSDPAYVVRKRLGDALENTDSRKEAIDVLEDSGKEIDEDVYNSIITDYEQEVGDVLGDSDAGSFLGKSIGKQDTGPRSFKSDGDMSEEEQKRKMKKFMRLSSLQIAYQAYPVFKSIVVN